MEIIMEFRKRFLAVNCLCKFMFSGLTAVPSNTRWRIDEKWGNNCNENYVSIAHPYIDMRTESNVTQGTGEKVNSALTSPISNLFVHNFGIRDPICSSLYIVIYPGLFASRKTTREQHRYWNRSSLDVWYVLMMIFRGYDFSICNPEQVSCWSIIL